MTKSGECSFYYLPLLEIIHILRSRKNNKKNCTYSFQNSNNLIVVSFFLPPNKPTGLHFSKYLTFFKRNLFTQQKIILIQ